MASAAELKPEMPVHPAELPPDHIYFGPSEAMQVVRKRVERAAALNVPILILGESGTGKEVLSRFIHNRSPWKTGPFVKASSLASRRVPSPGPPHQSPAAWNWRRVALFSWMK